MKMPGNLVSLTKFRTEEEAIAVFEKLRWPNGPACPHCGGAAPYRLVPKSATPGKRKARIGLWKCSPHGSTPVKGVTFSPSARGRALL